MDNKKSVGFLASEELQKKGGPNSGNYGHTGRPGKLGGSSSSTQVGITSARPDKPPEQVVSDKADFEKELKKTPARDIKVQLGRGGWEGGWEPTFITSYNGNGKTFDMLIKEAKKYDQDGILFMRKAKKGDADSNPVISFNTGKRLNETEFSEVEKTLAANGFGGWTWHKSKGGISQLTLAAVPEYGADKVKFEEAAKQVQKSMKTVFPKNKEYVQYRKVHLIGRDQYDDLIKNPKAKEKYL